MLMFCTFFLILVNFWISCEGDNVDLHDDYRTDSCFKTIFVYLSGFLIFSLKGVVEIDKGSSKGNCIVMMVINIVSRRTHPSRTLVSLLLGDKSVHGDVIRFVSPQNLNWIDRPR
jgi:hypothetical protein